MAFRGYRSPRLIVGLVLVMVLAGVGVAAAVATIMGDTGEGGLHQKHVAVKPGPPPIASTPRVQTGWPDASTTGVPAGTKLSVVKHGLTIRKAGTVIDRREIHGDVTILANNVKITESRILGEVTIPYGHEDVRGVTVTDTEMNGQRQGAPNQAEPGISTYGGISCIRCNIHGFNVGVAINGEQPTLIQDSWVHDIWPPSSGHKDAVITNGSSNVTIDHNRLSCEVDGCSAAIGMFGDFSAITNWRVNDNLLNGGSYCSYSGSLDAKKYPVASDITWTNNHYGHELYPDCGIYGAATGWSEANGNRWSGNTTDRRTSSHGDDPQATAAVPEPQG
jgi:hypothetical protein